jgi:hypothetical protein
VNSILNPAVSAGAFDDLGWMRELFAWAQAMPKPKNILIISAHWESAPLALSASAARTAGLRLRRLPSPRPRPGPRRGSR